VTVVSSNPFTPLLYFAAFVFAVVFLAIFMYVADIAGSNLNYANNYLIQVQQQLNNTLPYHVHINRIDWTTYTMYPAQILEVILPVVLVVVLMIYLIHVTRR
jgi:hypothetical protein